MNIFEKGGILDNFLDGYVERPGQVKMARALSSMLHNPDPTGPKVVIAEGPVGVGKSLAYLFSSLFNPEGQFVGANVIVSTSSITLQDQLVNKDLPFVASVIEKEFGEQLTFAAMKGITNYVCLKKFYDNELTLSPELSKYVRTTELGEKPNEVDAREWDLITTSHNECEGRECPVFDMCFYQKQRKKALESDVMVVNHAILATDMAIKEKGGKGILGDRFHFLVIDECHELENSVVGLLSERLSRRVIQRLFAGLTNMQKKIREKFVLEEDEITTLNSFGEMLAKAVDGLPEFLEYVAERHPEGLIKEGYDTSTWIKQLSDFMREVELSVIGMTKDEEGEDIIPVSTDRFIDQVFNVIIRLEWLKTTPKNVAIYVEGKEEKSIVLSPINVADFLAPLWMDPNKRFVLTSATCSVDKSFDFIKSRLGIPSEISISGMFESPFDYKKQAMLIVPRHFNPKSVHFDDQVLFGISEIIKFGAQHNITKAMVLFTSYAQMNRLTPEIKFRHSSDYLVLDQNPGMSRAFILEKFQNEPKSILVAQAASFGTGVDIKGNKIVILVRLNFDVPTDPLFVARSEAIEAEGGNAFTGLAIPNVVIRTKQQIGRSVRSDSDRAIIAIFDGRLNRPGWGRKVLNSLPEMMLWRMDDWTDEVVLKDAPFRA